MTPYYDDEQARFYLGDVREVLRSMPDGSVDMCVTSPPYWSLRDYGIEPSVWGGEADCAHEWGLIDGHPAIESGAFCQRCGAWRGCLGLETEPTLFVEHIVEVFREVRRVMADDGTLWLNLGDSFAGSWGAQGRQGTNGQMASRSVVQARSIDAHPQRLSGTGSTANMPGVKPKDLVGIPWLVAFALRADGWWLRQDIIWSKPNPMPESVTDRCTKAHEYLFLLSKRERYYYDQEAIRERAAFPDGAGNTRPYEVPNQREGDNHNFSGSLHKIDARETRNKRSVWSIPTSPFPEAHFATFPPDLVKPCILAGSRIGGTVLDAFLGSGTTAMVAKSLGRRAVGIDLNPEYLDMARRRCAQMALEVGS